jgi:Flp pilus assembly protein TadD
LIWRDGATLFTHVLGTVHTEPYVTTFQVRLASALEARMNYDQALAQNEALLAKYPDVISLKKKTADLLLRLGRTEGARNRYRKALLENPESADLHNGFGVLLALGGDFDAATNQFWEPLRLDPKFANAYRNLALVASNRGQPEEAARFFAREKELSDSIPQSK